MSLVAYSDSESDQSDKDCAVSAQPASTAPNLAAKRKRSESASDQLPPLPAAFHDLYATNARIGISDDPSLHGGRKRTVPHIEGNWPSHVFLEWIPSQTESTDLHSLIQHVRNSLQLQSAVQTKRLKVPDIIPSLQSDLGASLPLHVSLSRTLQIRTEDRTAFLESLKSSLRKAAVRTFHFDFHSLKWVPNFDRSRWFLVLSIKQPAQDELNRLLHACNEAAEKSGHLGLYTGGHGDGPMEVISSKSQHHENERFDRSEYFHISIAWNLTEPDPAWVSFVQSIDISKHISSPEATYDAVKVKIGNTIHSITLGPQKFGLQKSGGALGLG